MNENSQPLAPTINSWLLEATTQLNAAEITSARLDAEILLAHTLKKPRTHLHAHGEDIIAEREREIANTRLLLRLDRVPLAYIIGHKEFYGRNFNVTPSTLIPRPESEDIIHLLQKIIPASVALISPNKKLVDVGTGSGCLGVTAKLEFPELDVTLLDISTYALKVAEENARRLKADVATIRSDLLQSYPFSPDIIIANLPYVDPDWDLSPELQHEPDIALFTSDGGLTLIKELIEQSSARLKDGGDLLLEADSRQHAEIISFARHHGFSHSETRGLIVWLKRHF